MRGEWEIGGLLVHGGGEKKGGEGWIAAYLSSSYSSGANTINFSNSTSLKSALYSGFLFLRLLASLSHFRRVRSNTPHTTGRNRQCNTSSGQSDS